MDTPEPTHLHVQDPATVDPSDIREEVDREIEAHGQDLHDLVLLVPEDHWDEFLRVAECPSEGDVAGYRGVTLRKGAVTAVVVQEGF